MTNLDFNEWAFHEMPLANYKVDLLDEPDETAFNTADRVVVSHPRTAKMLEKTLSKHGWNFNILMLEYPGGSYFNTGKIAEKARVFMFRESIPTQNHITYVKSNSTGDLLTPWMIYHTFGHALLDKQSKFVPENNKMFDLIKYELKMIYETHEKAAKTNPDWTDLVNISNQNEEAFFLSRLFQFRSATNLISGNSKKALSTDGYDELIYELVAEFLWNGKIRVNYSAAKLRGGDYTNRAAFNFETKVLDQHVKTIEGLISASLNNAVGKIIIDEG